MEMSNLNSSSSFPVKLWNKSKTEQPIPNNIQLSTFDNGVSQIILDYGRVVGGIPFFETTNVQSDGDTAILEITYSESRAGIDKEKGTLSTSSSQYTSNCKQAMGHFCCFPMQWILTESTRNLSHPPKIPNTWKQCSLKSRSDIRSLF
jgi:hypothetical protein